MTEGKTSSQLGFAEVEQWSVYPGMKTMTVSFDIDWEVGLAFLERLKKDDRNCLGVEVWSNGYMLLKPATGIGAADDQ